MLSIKHISMRNFFSFGNAPQTVDLDSTDISLILGQNNDASPGDDNSGRRNGVGKSAIIQGIVFGLYGKSIGNDIKIPNLINKTNTRNCEVSIDFIKDGVEYRIERGRSPTFFNFYTLDATQTVVDESRGEKKDTQEDLNEILGISQLLFEHIVVLNANVEPFLSLSQQKQREMIEELLGITQLTEKANLLKDMYKESRRLADQEKFKIETITESNRRIEQSIESLQNQANNFEKTKNQTIESYTKQLEDFIDVDFDILFELAAEMEAVIEHNKARSVLENRINTLAIKHEEYSTQLLHNKEAITAQIEELSKIDITAELNLHSKLAEWNLLDQSNKEAKNIRRFAEQKISSRQSSITLHKDMLRKENEKLNDITNSICPTCKNSIEHDQNHSELKERIVNAKIELAGLINAAETDIIQLEIEISNAKINELPDKPVPFYSTLSEAKLHEHKLEELKKKVQEDSVNIYDEELIKAFTELESIEEKEYVSTFSTSEVKELQYTYNNLVKSLEREMNSSNPYFTQIETLKTNSIQTVSYDEYNNLSKLAEHQDFLTKLLMNKDSFVRRRIIENNTLFLNTRLQYWIEKIGSQHTVEFLNDLSVDISLNGQSYDFRQLSRGERTRVNIALSLAFRDTYESLYQNINLLIIDEMIDVGLDSAGVMQVWNIFNDISSVLNKNVFVISHREELVSKVEIILKVVKEDGFSTVEYATIDDIY